MKKYLLSLSIISLALSCTEVKKNNDSYIGTFTTTTGTKFVLRADSTATIYFNDTSVYEAIWRPEIARDSFKYANIEFAGYTTYYFLHNNKLYRSSMQMRNDYLGEEVTYIDE